MVRYKFVHFNKRSDFDSYVPNPESNSANGNEYYNYVVFIKDTKEIYTHGQFYNCSDSGDSSIDEILEELKSSINSKADLSSLEALIKEVEENEEVTAAALTELHENKADKSEIPDVSNLVTKNEFNILSAEVEEKVDSTIFTTLSETVAGHTTNINNLSDNKADKTDLEDYAKKDDLNTKQDQLVSGTTIKTVNGNSILGSGNIETPDTKVTSADNHYGYDANNAISTTGAFVTKITKDAANHVTSFESRALTSTDIPGLDASKITTGEISIDRLPKGALERLFVVESEAAAISATVQEGDVVQVTGNNNKMYFCISNTATTFATKFKEFTAGTATSVPWSGITGKPTGIDGWGDRIGVIESGYATQSWVGENYLSKAGGVMAKNSYIDWGNTDGFEDYSAYSNGFKILGYNGGSGDYRGGIHVGVRYGWQLTRNAGSEVFQIRNYSPSSASWGDWKTLAFTDSNVASATKLATPRTIWGQSFDGTGDINGAIDVSLVASDLDIPVIKFASDCYFDKYGNYVFGKSAGSFSVFNGSHLNAIFHVLKTGNVAIGAKTADEKLHVYGNVKASGSMYAVDFATTSDNRLKDFVSDIYVDFESIKQIPKKYYYWKDKSMGEDLQIGTSAQELAKIYPECVHYDETNDRYSVNYQKLSIVALAAIDKLHDRVSELESKLYDKNN